MRGYSLDLTVQGEPLTLTHANDVDHQRCLIRFEDQRGFAVTLHVSPVHQLYWLRTSPCCRAYIGGGRCAVCNLAAPGTPLTRVTGARGPVNTALPSGLGAQVFEEWYTDDVGPLAAVAHAHAVYSACTHVSTRLNSFLPTSCHRTWDPPRTYSYHAVPENI